MPPSRSEETDPASSSTKRGQHTKRACQQCKRRCVARRPASGRWPRPVGLTAEGCRSRRTKCDRASPNCCASCQYLSKVTEPLSLNRRTSGPVLQRSVRDTTTLAVTPRAATSERSGRRSTFSRSRIAPSCSRSAFGCWRPCWMAPTGESPVRPRGRAARLVPRTTSRMGQSQVAPRCDQGHCRS